MCNMPCCAAASILLRRCSHLLSDVLSDVLLQRRRGADDAEDRGPPLVYPTGGMLVAEGADGQWQLRSISLNEEEVWGPSLLLIDTHLDTQLARVTWRLQIICKMLEETAAAAEGETAAEGMCLLLAACLFIRCTLRVLDWLPVCMSMTVISTRVSVYLSVCLFMIISLPGHPTVRKLTVVLGVKQLYRQGLCLVFRVECEAGHQQILLAAAERSLSI